MCSNCDKMRERVQRAKTEEDMVKASKELAQHLEAAQDERDYYNDVIDSAKQSIAEAEEQNTQPITSHYTFDFAQQLELPFHTRQVGPLYFKSRFKVQLFDVCNEAAHKQTNFIFHEGESIGADGKKSHGPNAVVSMLNYELENDSPGADLHLHADNCVGQNKNKTLIAYIVWRTLTSRSDQVELSFMKVGHTRCTVDGYFGLLKMKVRSSDLDTMDDVETAINSSSTVKHCTAFHLAVARVGHLFQPVFSHQ